MAVVIALPSSPQDRWNRWAVVPSALAELTALLHAMAGPAHHYRSTLRARTEAALSGGARRELTRLSILWSGYRARMLLPHDLTSGRVLEDELEAVRTLPISLFVEAAAWAVRGGHSGAPSGQALLGSASAQAEVLERARSRGPLALEVAQQLFSDPETFRERLVGLLIDAAAPAFTEYWDELIESLDASARAKTLLATRAGLAAMLASLTPAAQVLADPIRVRFDKVHHGYVSLDDQPLRLVPSIHVAPHFLVKHEPGWIPLVQYRPVSAEEERRSPTLEEVRLRLGTLVDATRLDLCRLIGREPATTTELAQRTGMSAPQVSRHLARLRAAGIVVAHREGRFVRYSLDLEGIGSLGPDLLTALLR